MGAGKFRGDEKRLESEIEEMAHVVYGLAKNEQSKQVARDTAGLLLTLSNVKFEKRRGANPSPTSGRNNFAREKGGK